jgi:excisionase family DNA binding protein
MHLRNSTHLSYVLGMPTHEITPKEAAEILGVSRATVQRYANAGLLHPRKLPSGFRRYDRADVERLRATMNPHDAPPDAA